MVADAYDAVVVGAGGDGPVTAWKLAEAGLSVLVLEAGPFHGNEQWPNPHEDPGGEASSSVEDLSGELLDEQFTTREFEMINKLVFGPADHERGFWFRKFPGAGATLQASGVGGTTLIYTGNHPRAYPAAIDEQPHWPDEFSYGDLLPYYREMEALLDVQPAPVSSKEELFFQGAESVDPDLLGGASPTLVDGKNVDEVGYRPQPNAIWGPDEKLHVDNDYDGDFRHPADPDAVDPVEGHTLATTELSGNPHPLGAPYEEKAKRTSAIGVVPKAMETGNVTVRPNAFVTDVLVDRSLGGNPEATGVEFRDTWSGDTEQVSASTVVLAAGAIETPRLWLNSGLPRNEWVGKGMTIHFGDNVMGFWEEEVLEERVGKPTADPQEGQTIAARFDYPGAGMLQTTGSYAGIAAILGFGASRSGFTFTNDVSDAPWDTQGRLAGGQGRRVHRPRRGHLPGRSVPHLPDGIESRGAWHVDLRGHSSRATRSHCAGLWGRHPH